MKVLLALATLLMANLLIMFSYSRKAVKHETLQKAAQTLEATVQNIDNILLNVEQAAGNIYWKILPHQNQPEKVREYCQRLVDGNPYITDCTIVMDTEPNAIDLTAPSWITQEKTNTSDEAITSFCLPIYTDGKKVGTMVVDVSQTLLSKIILETKPSPHSFCTLLGKDGSFVVSPDSTWLNHSIFKLASGKNNLSIRETARKMVAGKTGYQHVELEGEDYYVFFKPYEQTEVPGRSMGDLGWSVAIVYPENDIFGNYNRLLYMVLLITVGGLLLLLLLCQTFIHRQLAPLRLLAKSAQRIAEGSYDERIPDSRRHDEVGRLQNHFQQMQQSLATRVGEMSQLTETLQERGKVLQTAYEETQVAERMKTNFLYNMSNQMMSPISGMYSSVMTISDCYQDMAEEDIHRLADDIQSQGEKITELLNRLITESENMVKGQKADA